MRVLSKDFMSVSDTDKEILELRMCFWTLLIREMKEKVADLLIDDLGKWLHNSIDGWEIRIIDNAIKFHSSLEGVTNDRMCWESMYRPIDNKEIKSKICNQFKIDLIIN